jgi:carbonic anhydrase/acetyltransferase-like protein (isoleucine patch superfamily)/deoxycytidylate deaminase
MSRPTWDEYFLRMATLAATRSTCLRRRVGAVLVRDQRVIATGYNGSLRGQPHCAEVGCLMVDGHCKRTVHAELNALLQCAFHGASSRDSQLFTTSFPCLDCAKAVVQAGVVRVVYRDAYPDAHSLVLLQDARIALARVPDGAGEEVDGMPLRALGAVAPRCEPSAFVAESAEVDGDVQLGVESSIWYGAVLRGDIAAIRVGARTSIQDGCILHTDAGMACVVGDGVTVGHGAVLHGCTVEDGALIGMRATVLTAAVVGRGAIVGAGAVVTEGQTIPAGMLAVGVPARVIRAVRPEETERMRSGVAHYVELAARHRAARRGPT